MSKCKGCGLTLQNEDKNALGYTPKLTNKLCERCFKITNYNYHDDGKKVDNEQICLEINNKKAFNFFMCDILSLNDKTISLFNKINNPKTLVITKADLLDKNTDYHRLIERIKEAYSINNVVVCSIKNYAGLQDIMYLINTYKKVVFCGPTSSGKSSLINHLFDYELTVSSFKNTTQEFISLKKDDLVIIDAPGFISDVITKKEKMLNPKTINVKKGYELVIDDISLTFDYEISLTLYISNNCLYKTRKIRKDYNNIINIKDGSDMTVKNIGFIYFKNAVSLKVSHPDDISIRKSVVGGL